MKTNLTIRFPFLALFMMVLIFSTPFTTLAQQISVEEQAKTAAKRDAETDTNKLLWAGTGFAIPFIAIIGGCVGLRVGSMVPSQSYSGSGIQLFSSEGAWGACIGMTVGCLIPFVVAYNYKLEPLPEHLLGKSPEYVDFYTSAYKTKTRQLRLKSAEMGIGTALALQLLIAYGIAIAQ